MISTPRLRTALASTALALALTACGDGAGEPNIADDPELTLPLQVYPNQTFLFDASGSTSNNGLIRGYVFSPGDDSPALISRSPRLAYRYEQLGTFDVSLRLVNGKGEPEQASIEVVSCDQPLLCLASRPCPPGFVCVDNDRCEPEFIACEAHSDCPAGLSCVQGACGAGGPCVDPVDPPDPPDPPDICQDHNSCEDDAFCVDGVCEPACDAACEEQIVASWELVAPMATGLAFQQEAFLRDPATTFYVMDQEGLLWPHSLELVEPFDDPDAPPRFQGLLAPDGDPFESALGFFVPGLHSLDIVDGAALGEPAIGAVLATAYLGDGAPSSEVGPYETWAVPVEPRPPFEPISPAEPIEAPVFLNNFDQQLVAYDITTNAILVGRELEREIATYTPEPGAVICGVVRDSDALYLVENRRVNGRFTAARLVKIVADDDVEPSYFGLVRPTCGIERGLQTREFYYASYTEGETAYLIQQQIPSDAP